MATGFPSSVETTIDVSGVNPFLEDKSNAIRAAIEQRMLAVSFMLLSKIVDEKLSGQLLNRRSGKLSDSVRVQDVVASKDSVEGGVTAGGGPVNYARALEYGSAPHIIVPKNAKALAFMIDGKQIFAKRVMHPGTKEYAFMRGTLFENEDKIKAEFQDAANEGAKG